MNNFSLLVPYIRENLKKHHEIYSLRCKAELWEEVSYKSFTALGLSSNWMPNYNHTIGVDQIVENISISNKSGTLNKKNQLLLSGSRTTKWKTLEEKKLFFSQKKEDYIFCLATKKEQESYYFIVIDNNLLDYHKTKWTTMEGRKGNITGWRTSNNFYDAKIVKQMSDQLWATVKPNAFKEFYEIIL